MPKDDDCQCPTDLADLELQSSTIDAVFSDKNVEKLFNEENIDKQFSEEKMNEIFSDQNVDKMLKTTDHPEFIGELLEDVLTAHEIGQTKQSRSDHTNWSKS